MTGSSHFLPGPLHLITWPLPPHYLAIYSSRLPPPTCSPGSSHLVTWPLPLITGPSHRVTWLVGEDGLHGPHAHHADHHDGEEGDGAARHPQHQQIQWQLLPRAQGQRPAKLEPRGGWVWSESVTTRTNLILMLATHCPTNCPIFYSQMDLDHKNRSIFANSHRGTKILEETLIMLQKVLTIFI